MANSTTEELAPIKRAVSICGISRSNIYRRIKAKTFPGPIYVGGRALWPISRLYAWTAAQVEANERSGENVGTE